MATVTTLKMAFNTADNKKRTLSISPAKPTVTVQQVRDFATAIIDAAAFIWSPSELIGAELINTTTNKLIS